MDIEVHVFGNKLCSDQRPVVDRIRIQMFGIILKLALLDMETYPYCMPNPWKGDLILTSEISRGYWNYM